MRRSTSTQNPTSVLMVRPQQFGYNIDTAESNRFQRPDTRPSSEIQGLAREEFEVLVGKMREHGIRVLVLDEDTRYQTPDAVFPNNWISFHEDGRIVLYPMLAPARRLERQLDVCAALREHGFICEPLIDLSMYEQQGRFLEGTGSLVFDRAHQRAYACASPRTDAALAERLCGELGYRLMLFDGRDSNGVPIYHTNVMLSIGEGFTVVCLDAVTEQPARDNLKHALLDSGHALITITLGQMQQFAGNIFSVRSISGETVTLMSTSAYQAFSPSQLACISRHSTILHSPIPTIEACGGGSVRCMLAGIHLPVIAT